MPVVLSEVGSITLRGEHDLLASDSGQDAVAAGLFDGLAAFFAGRSLAARMGIAPAPVGEAPQAVPGNGPPFWAPIARERALDLRLTNTGAADWPDGLQLVAGWEASDQPYLAKAPAVLRALAAEVPPLAPGASVIVSVALPEPPAGRGVAWISLIDARGATFADRGSPALQLSNRAP